MEKKKGERTNLKVFRVRNKLSQEQIAKKIGVTRACYSAVDEQYDTDYHLDATDFLKIFDDSSVDTVLYDPPYSPRQVAECYKQLGLTVNMETTQASYWAKQKDEIGRIVKKGGIVITCGWNSGGIGKKHGFEIVEILLVAHGRWHNDTIVTVERKL